MNSLKTLTSKDPSGGAGGVPAYLTSTQYYLGRDGQEQSASAWCGSAARTLGLMGQPVTEELMNRLGSGFAPDGKTELRQGAGKKPEIRKVKDRSGKVRLNEKGEELTATHGMRIGTESTLSAPKSMSILMAFGDAELRQATVDAQHRAVDKTIAFYEKHCAETRRGKGGKEVLSAELVISRHTHFGARPHESDWKQRGDHELDIDPQLHTHCLIYNVCRGSDGQWGTLEPSEIWRWKKAIGAMYRAELASEMQKLGFQIEDDIRYDQDGKVTDRFWKIAGIPDELSEQMSGRRKEILAYMKEHGGTAQQATLKTRRNKDEPTFAEMHARWQEDLALWRREHPGLLPENLRDLANRGHRTPSHKQTQVQRDQELLAELHESKSVWTRADLVQKLAERSTGTSAAQVWREAGAFLKRNELQLIEPEKIHKDDRGQHLSRRYTQTRFADPKVVKQEQDIVAMAKARLHDQTVRLDPKVLKKAIAEMEQERGFKLSPEQRKGAEFICCGSGGIAVVQGWAGTGKTTVSDAVVKAYRESGFQVIGCATAWKAAKKLEAESGVTSYSIAQMVDQLDKGKMKLTAKTVVLVDEAGMMGTPSLRALIGHAHEAGSKLICQGDVLQLQSVERGAPMRAMSAAIGYTELKDIRRQKKQEDRDIALAFYGAGGTEQRSRSENEVAGQKILQGMEANGQIQAFDTRDQAREYLVKDYLASPKPAREKLVLAATRGDVDLLNSAIRDGRKAKGELGLDHTVGVSNPRTKKLQDLVVAKGDRLMFTKKSKELGVVNGTMLVVTGVIPDGRGGHTIQGTIESDIKKEDGRQLAFAAKDVSLMHSYASTVHKSQGQSVSEVYHLGHRGMTDRQLALVGFTRMKDHYTLYGPIDELFDRSGDAAWAQDRLQVNALEEGLSQKHGGMTTTQWLKQEAQKGQSREKPEHRHEGTRAGLLKDSKFLKAAGEAFRKLRDRQQTKQRDLERQAQRDHKRDRERGPERS
jgi:conjugative relaxase-like TrwC/TraI family protein